MLDFLLQDLSLSLLTLLSLIVNAITIYRWIGERNERKKTNDQAFHMLMGLAHANSKRSGMIVSRIQTLQAQGKFNDESMVLLENMYADTNANIETLLAAAKALKPHEANKLPPDGSALLANSINTGLENQLRQQELKLKILEASPKTKKVVGSS